MVTTPLPTQPFTTRLHRSLSRTGFLVVLTCGWAAPIGGPAAMAQSFNVDLNTSVAATSGLGPPSAAFGGAAAQPGAWNALSGNVALTLNLVDLAGAPTGVTLARNVATGGNFNFDNPNTTGDHQLLMDDGYDGAVNFTFTGLAAGVYDVITYAVAPDDPTAITAVTVPGSTSPNPQLVGGVIPVNSFAAGVTHCVHTVTVCPGTPLVVQSAVGTLLATTNGIQLVYTGPPTSICASGAASPPALLAGESTLLTVAVSTDTPPTTVTANLSQIGGAAAQSFFDDATNGDVTAGDNIYSFEATVAPAIAPSTYNLPFTATDQVGSASGNIVVTINPVSDFPEVEPNDNKTQATSVAGIANGQSIAGVTTGATAAPGLTSVDYFRVKTTPAALGIYRHRLTLTTAGTAGHVGTIRGLTQTTGVINPGTDATIQTALTTLTAGLPARTVQWYGFGKEEEIYYRVAGVAATTAPYFATLSTTPVTTLDATLNYDPGNISIAEAPASVGDLDFWVYDSDLNPIPAYGHDQPDTTPFVKNYAAGTYYIALSVFNLANNQPQPLNPGESTSDFVLDFPNAVADSSTGIGTNISIILSDGVHTETIPAVKAGPFDIVFVKFTVGAVVGCACPGDMDTSVSRNGLDVSGFVACMLGGGANCGCADVDGTPGLTADDVPPFINLLLNSPACP